MLEVKEHLKRIDWVLKTYSWIANKYYQVLTILSPKWNTIALYKANYGEKPNLEKPKTFSEKLLYLKLNNYIYNPLVKQCADKYAVREYLMRKGLEELLVPLIASYNSVSEIKWDVLPESFAMKWNFGCGFNIICHKKSELDVENATRLMSKWGKDKKCYLDFSELQYKGVAKKIIVEQFLCPKSGLQPEDYKVYCFNGKPLAILFISGRGTDIKEAGFFDIDWKYISSTGKDCYRNFDIFPPKPGSLSVMLEAAKKLADGFPFVRVDFYDVDGKCFFGEMTFTPAGGLHTSECIVEGKTMGELLDIGL